MAVKIERVEPCEHGAMTAHVIDWSARPLEDCDGGSRSVLSGFPPEAVEAAAVAMVDGGNVDDLWRSWAEAALAAAWDYITGDKVGPSDPRYDPAIDEGYDYEEE